MASWNELLNYVYSKYKVDNQWEDSISLTFTFDDGRSQLVSIARRTNQRGVEWIQIESGVGRLGQIDLVDTLRQVNPLICGGVSVSGDYVTLRHSAPLADLSIEEFEWPLEAIVASADTIEERTSRVDTL